MKVASLETDTATEQKNTKKAISSLDKNLEQRFEDFKSKFHSQIKLFEKKVRWPWPSKCCHRWRSLKGL